MLSRFQDSSQHQNIIGNYINPGSFSYDRDDRWPANIDLSTYILHGNEYAGEIYWDPAISDHTIPVSYYYTQKPDFYGSLSWPSVGVNVVGGGTNPAMERWLAGNPTPDSTPIPDSTPTPKPPVELGDVNTNGNVDIVDALLTAQYYVGLAPSGFYPINADVDCDSFIDIVDALLIAQYYVGLIGGFCEEKVL